MHQLATIHDLYEQQHTLGLYKEVQYWLTHSGSDATTAEGVFRVELLRHIRDADDAEIDRKQVCLDIVPAQMSP